MKNIALGAAFVLTFLSWSAVAEEQGSMHEKTSTEDQCKAMAVQHGMKGDKLDAWVAKCLDMSKKMKSDRGMSEDNDANEMQDSNGMEDSNDMRDPEDGDSDMGGEGMGDENK
jgi:hypothetical protein